MMDASRDTDMTNPILYATDFPDASSKALEWAVRLAKQLNSHLTILYTYRLLKQNGEILLIKKKMEDEGLTKFKALEKQLLQGTGVSYDFRTEVGFIDDRIEEYTKMNKISFLVIDKNMSTRNKESFDGLVGKLHSPLVLVP
jgi:nucleotide-binding universal stress UspA family protein